ncbi:MAG: S1C family serine protease [bacterium]
MNKNIFGFVVYFCLLLIVACGKPEEHAPMKNLDLVSLTTEPPGQHQRYASNDQISYSRETAITRAVRKASGAVCGINVTQMQELYPAPFYDDPFYRLFFSDRRYREPVKSLGSGFLISPNGFILTNEHVVDNATEIVVTLTDGSTKNAKVVGMDYITDIALLKIEGDQYPYIKFGDSDDIIIGEWVIALGNPFGLFELNAKPTVTVGVVSAVDRDFGKQKNQRVYQDMIQTDAAINQGNSGGPLLNSLGDVIGMNTFIFTGSKESVGSIGLGFAIPINRVKEVLSELKKYGEIDHSYWSGLEVDDITPIMARYFKLDSRRGVIVTNVESGSPAERAGLEIGDVILEVNGQQVKSPRQIRKIIEDADLRGGDILHLKVQRGHELLNISLQLESAPR